MQFQISSTVMRTLTLVILICAFLAKTSAHAQSWFEQAQFRCDDDLGIRTSPLTKSWLPPYPESRQITSSPSQTYVSFQQKLVNDGTIVFGSRFLINETTLTDDKSSA